MKTIELNEQVFEPIDPSVCQEVRGGSIFAAILIGIGLAAGEAIIEDWDNFKAGLLGKPEVSK